MVIHLNHRFDEGLCFVGDGLNAAIATRLAGARSVDLGFRALGLQVSSFNVEALGFGTLCHATLWEAKC